MKVCQIEDDVLGVNDVEGGEQVGGVDAYMVYMVYGINGIYGINNIKYVIPGSRFAR